MPVDLYISAQNAFSHSQPQCPTPANDTPLEHPENDILEDPGVEGKRANTRASSNTTSNAQGAQLDRQIKSVMPANPFKISSKLSELGSCDSGETLTSTENSKAKGHYDVDGFKRLLLAGDTSVIGAGASIAPSVSFQGQQTTRDNRSDTKPYPASRQSVFGFDSGPNHDSPRTSIELSSSDEEQQRLVGTSSPREARAKPSAPKPRHGKLVKANAPQTVSFEDRTLSVSESEVKSAPLTEHSAQRSPSEIDRPRPVRPLSVNAESGPENIINSDLSSRNDPKPSKKNPPPPPVARRHARPKSFLGVSGSSDPISEEILAKQIRLSQSPPLHPLKAPPLLPRPRRSGPARGESSSLTPTIDSLSSVPDVPSGHSLMPKTRPPLPPARSISSSSSASKRAVPTKPGSSSPSIAPPPPPRRRGSSQSSYPPTRRSGDYRNSFTERLRSNSGASFISEDSTSSQVADRETNDVMTDLSRLQKEVDDLRAGMKESSVELTM